MKAHLHHTDSTVTVVDVADFPEQPLLLSHDTLLFVNRDPGFANFDGTESYMDYAEAAPVQV